MTENTICANSFIFLTAGSESTANTISFTLLNLTQHPEVQQRVQREVDSVLKQHGGWNYDAIRDLTYMDQVIQGTCITPNILNCQFYIIFYPTCMYSVWFVVIYHLLIFFNKKAIIYLEKAQKLVKMLC